MPGLGFGRRGHFEAGRGLARGEERRFAIGEVATHVFFLGCDLVIIVVVMVYGTV